MSKPFIHTAILVDVSGSMAGKELLIQSNLDALLNQFRGSTVPMSVQLYYFNTELKHSWTRPHTELPKADRMYCNGGTALYDSLHNACERLYVDPTPLFHDPVYVVHVITDGLDENSLKPYSTTVAKLFKAPNWTFAISGPDKYASKCAMDLGVPKEIILPWDGMTAKSYEQSQTATRASFTEYVDSVSKGKSKVESFYASVKTDLTKLLDVRNHYKELKVDKDDRIDEFVMRKTKKEYRKGVAYYELIKEEKVQLNKELLAQHKITGQVVSASRPDLGLSTSADAKVTPGNFGDWRVYVQSKADNRKLSRGSRILVSK